MTGLTTATLRTQARRYVGPGLAIALGVAFLTATLVLGASLTASVRAAVAGDLAGWSVVADPVEPRDGGPRTLDEGTATAVSDLPGVAEVLPERSGILLRDDGADALRVTTPPAPESPGHVTAGRLPSAADEVALSTRAAESLDLRVGGRLATPGGSVAVVGVLDAATGAPSGGPDTVFATPQGVTELTGVEGWTRLRIAGGEGVPAVRLVADVRTLLGARADVATGEEAARDAVDELSGGHAVLTGFLLAFAAVALVVSAIVIANTFSVLLARRARETALLRAIGASRRQVVRSALAESVTLAVVASVVGVGLGALTARVLVGAAGAADLSVPLTTVAVPPSAVLVPLAVGVLVTVAAALTPVVRSSRVPPMAALRPELAVTPRTRAGRVRVGTGVLGLVAGLALLAAGARGGSVAAGVAGGVVSFVGVLLAGSVLVPPLARLLGLTPARWGGAPAQIAVDTTVREPARSAATASALLVGVTLIVMMSVGAATAQRSVASTLDDRLSVDVAVTSSTPLPESATRLLARVPDTDTTAALPGVVATIGSAERQPVLASSTDAARVVRSDVLDVVEPGVLLTTPGAAEAAGVRDGGRVTVSAGERRRDLTVRVRENAPVPFLVDRVDLTALDADPRVLAVLSRLTDDADARTVLHRVEDAVAGTDATIGGGASVRAEVDGLVETVLRVVTALLAVSVVIAVVGIGTALSLSVIERRRELALLRALGMTRAQVMSMLAGESLLLAVVATVVGTLLGVAYGVAGVMSILGDTVAVLPDLAGGRVAVVGLAAAACGLLAAVLPGWRATRVAPAGALDDA